MIKFINNIDNLLSDILHNNKTLIIFFENNNINCIQLIDKINAFDLDLIGTIILVDLNIFLKENYNKLNNGFISDFLKYSCKYNYEKQINNLNFLSLENIKNLKLPQLYFIKNSDNITEHKYSTHYIAQYDNNNIINMINYFFKNNNKIKKNNYKDEFTKNGEVQMDIKEKEIEENIIFI